MSSSRFRVRQYITELQRYSIDMVEHTAPLGAWPPRNRLLRPSWAIATLASRLPAIAASYGYDLTFLQREMLSTFRTLEPLTKSPRILDVDDAIWLSRESQLRKLVQSVDGVVCGNDFIDAWASQWNSNRIIIPTAVDTSRWVPILSREAPLGEPTRTRVIGWSGLHSGAKYLLDVEQALAEVLRSRPDVIVRVVSDRRPNFRFLPADKIEYIQWSPANEVETIQGMTIGLMPLHDTQWERGKCSYKMLLYMACEVPVVVSPVGMNAQVLGLGEAGLPAAGGDEWVAALTTLLDDPERRQRMGVVGRQVVVEHFSLRTLAAEMAGFFRTFSG